MERGESVLGGGVVSFRGVGKGEGEAELG